MNAPVTALRVPEHDVHPQFPARWSPRAFTAETMTEAEVLRLLEAARWAPSAMNLQPWRFVYGLRGDAGFAAILSALVPFNAAWAKESAALIAVASKTTRTAQDGSDVPNVTHAFDTGAAWASLAMQAHLAGYATHGMGGFDAAKAAEALHLPADHTIHAIIAIGRQGEAAQLDEGLRARETPSLRAPLNSIAFHGRFPG